MPLDDRHRANRPCDNRSRKPRTEEEGLQAKPFLVRSSPPASWAERSDLTSPTEPVVGAPRDPIALFSERAIAEIPEPVYQSRRHIACGYGALWRCTSLKIRERRAAAHVVLPLVCTQCSPVKDAAVQGRFERVIPCVMTRDLCATGDPLPDESALLVGCDVTRPARVSAACHQRPRGVPESTVSPVPRDPPVEQCRSGVAP